MSYEKAQATEEFSRWSEGYDRSILQWLLFGPAHRAILTRLRGNDSETGLDGDPRRGLRYRCIPPPASRIFHGCLGPPFGG